MQSVDPPERFSLVVGGPFSDALRRLGLTGSDQLPTPRAALGLALLAWGIPALLVAAQSLLDARYAGWSFFTDLTVYARYLLALGVMIATERYADGRIILLTRQFRDARLLPDDSRQAFSDALVLADRRSSSRLAEAIVLLVAFALSSLTAHLEIELAGSTWLGAVVSGEIVYSWGGQASRFVSNPLFLFLVFRWVWRFVVWTVLLFRISRLRLQLTPLHPDRAAGLGFLAIYPSIFGGFVFALSCVVASSMVKEIGLARHDPDLVWFAIAGWIAFNLILFLGPLLVFAAPLYAARERGLLEYGRLAAHHHLAFHRKWIDGARDGGEMLGTTDPSSAADLDATVQAVLDMRFAPIDLPAVLQLVVASGIPMIGVVLTQIPLAELLKMIAGTIL